MRKDISPANIRNIFTQDEAAKLGKIIPGFYLFSDTQDGLLELKFPNNSTGLIHQGLLEKRCKKAHIEIE